MPGRRVLIDRLEAEFPEVFREIPVKDHDSPHLVAAGLRAATERAMDEGRFWEAERHFRFVDRLRGEADPELENALAVSYLEDLANGECTPQRYRAVKERMPRAMRAVMAAAHPNWR